MVKNPPATAGDTGNAGLILGLGKTPREENGNPLWVFLPGESHGQRSLVGYTVHRSKRVVCNWATEHTQLLAPLLLQPIYLSFVTYSSIHSLSLVPLFATPWTAAHQASLSITNSQSLLKLMSIKSVMPSNHIILCHLLLLLPSIFPSSRVFSNESVLHIRWPKYWSFSFSISSSNEYSGLISFKMDWLDFLAVQETLKSLLQHHSSKASILWCSAFFIVQLSHPYMTTEKPQP